MILINVLCVFETYLYFYKILYKFLHKKKTKTKTIKKETELLCIIIKSANIINDDDIVPAILVNSNRLADFPLI